MEVAPTKVEGLLATLCVELGCCLPPLEAIRLAENPPRNVEAFTDAVIEAEGCDDLRTRRQVREIIAEHFRRWEGEALQADSIDELSRYAPKSADA
jgi:hypothetical protein